MRLLCRVIESSGMLGLHGASPRAVGAILSDLIDGKEIEAHLLHELDTGVAAPWQLAAVWSPMQDPDNYARNIVERFELAGVPCVPFARSEGAYVLAASGDCEKLVRKVLGDAAQRSFAAVISLPLDDLGKLRLHHDLMDFVRDGLAERCAVVEARDYALPYMLEGLDRAMPAADLVHPALAVLARHDAETHSELIRTLQVYLANERNHVRTAAELGLHRNSLTHRIRRIEALTGIDFNNVDERFFLELSLRLTTHV